MTRLGAAGCDLPVEPLPSVGLGIWLWRASLDGAGEQLGLSGWLSDDERSRSETLSEPDRRRFIACRAVLRGLLGNVVGVQPGRLRFDLQPGTTKPRLAWPAAAVSFNVSHSADQALFGIGDSSVNAIGVDIEKVRPDVDVDAVAARFFSAREQARLSAIADRSVRRDAYFACWTAKEAVVKGIGVGLDLPFDLFDVALDTRQATVVTGRGRARGLVDGWVVHQLDLGPGWAGAVSVWSASVNPGRP